MHRMAPKGKRVETLLFPHHSLPGAFDFLISTATINLNPMKISLEDLKSKKVAILGFGLEGQSLANYFEKKGIKFDVLDQNKEVKSELAQNTITGGEYFDNLTKYQYIFRSPGIRNYLPEIVEAKKAGVEISSLTKLFFDLSPAKIIGVTGTKGKGTTSTLVYKILKSEIESVYLGGNIGESPLDFLDKLTSKSLVVLELSSFQLVDLERSPQVAVVLMVTSEHLDWHKSTDEYLEAKANIVSHQQKDDISVINADYPNSLLVGGKSGGQKYLFSRKTSVSKGTYVMGKEFLFKVGETAEVVAKTYEIGLIGKHNFENILASILVGKVFNISNQNIAGTLKEFTGLPHRLEHIANIKGIDFYNDSFSTTPETSIAAIGSFERGEILILGGSSKNSDFSKLGEVIGQSPNVRIVILIGQEALRIKAVLANYKGKIVEGLKSMQEIVQTASKMAKEGEVVILSPACASFDMFNNYKQRGDKFREEVEKLRG